MSKENAKKYYENIVAKGEQDYLMKKSADEMMKLIAEESLSFTFDELKAVIKESITTQDLSLNELELVSGGVNGDRGNCSANYYKKPCAATVENGSWCWTNDECILIEVIYDDYVCDGSDASIKAECAGNIH